LVTFGDPEKTSLKINFQEFVSFKNVHWTFSPGLDNPGGPPEARQRNNPNLAAGVISLVTSVDQTWNSLIEGLERIDAAVEELLNEEGR